MSITIEGTRFGTLELPEEAAIEFPAGLIGLPGSRYALVAREETSAFYWLQSLDQPEVAIPVTNPGRFFDSYDVEISDADAERIGIDESQQADVYVTVRAAERPEDFRANLLAPILIANGRGWQVVNEVPGLAVRAPLFADEAGDQAA
jgi:flagellar assembly factor FliW